ncbi:MAG: ABC transporter permease [Lachnospirales bacterium]
MNKKEGFIISVKSNWQLWMLLLPAIFYVLIFCYQPMYGALIAFKDFDPRLGIMGSEWVGLKYFKQFFETSIFEKTFRNTILLSIYGLIWGFPIPIIFALLLNQIRNAKFKSFMQTITYAPNFISIVVLVGMVTLFLSSGSGFLTNIFEFFGAEDTLYLVRPEYFRTIYIASGIWQSMGFSSIVFVAALTGVSPEFHESAMIDGASILKRIWYVDIPTILPTIVIMLILAVGNILSVGYEKDYLLQNGMNLEVSEIISTYVYKVGIQSAQYSFATAVGLFNSVINLVLLILANFFAKKTTEIGLF